MTSQVLVEGVSDVKDPKGSEDRKFWKAWHQQRISFSVVYPSGRLEPYLLLNLSNVSSEVSEREMKLSRDGLRLFRCRSKTRPYRTWAIASGNKVALYFAAENEIQTQNWMQALREGLWPPCFSFQMLTACSYEVSLIDDNNTFLSGLLGVYGRFVLTSEDTISLVHPYWGATSLEISLDNIIDVRFVREAGVSPAGVFNILLKRVHGSKIKSLQFFCNTTKDTIQWILSKLYTRKKSLCVTSTIIQEMDKQNITDLENEYENLQYIKERRISENESSWIKSNLKTAIRIGKEKSAKNGLKEISITQKINSCSKDIEIENEMSVDTTISDNIYANITNRTDCNEQVHEKLSDEELDLPNKVCTTLPSNFTLSDSTMYAAINKPIILRKLQQTSNERLSSCSENITLKNDTQINNLDNASLKTTITEKNNCISNSSSDVLQIDSNLRDCKIDVSAHDPLLDIKRDSNGQLDEGKRFSNNLSNHTQISEFPLNNSMNNNGNTYKNNSYLLPNFPSDFLDTSFNSHYLGKRNRDSGSSSSEEATENLPWLKNEFENFSEGSHVYEGLLQRSGTVYEEIDDTEDDSSAQLLTVPELPKRPQNLLIPDSLRLQKLSSSIQQTLQVMEDPPSSKKEHHHINFIKKIKDINRVMRVSPNQEYAKEPFTVELKLQADTKNAQFLAPRKKLVKTKSAQY